MAYLNRSQLRGLGACVMNLNTAFIIRLWFFTDFNSITFVPCHLSCITNINSLLDATDQWRFTHFKCCASCLNICLLDCLLTNASTTSFSQSLFVFSINLQPSLYVPRFSSKGQIHLYFSERRCVMKADRVNFWL
jgi:hypothetical protein